LLPAACPSRSAAPSPTSHVVLSPCPTLVLVNSPSYYIVLPVVPFSSFLEGGDLQYKLRVVFFKR
jgi:hypothetical protein